MSQPNNPISSRKASVARDTLETQIVVSLNLDGTGEAVFDTGIPFLEHMLDQIARHGLIDLDIGLKATYILTTTTRWKTSASPWVKLLLKRWVIKKVFAVMAMLTYHLMKPCRCRAHLSADRVRV